MLVFSIQNDWLLSSSESNPPLKNYLLMKFIFCSDVAKNLMHSALQSILMVDYMLEGELVTKGKTSWFFITQGIICEHMHNDNQVWI